MLERTSATLAAILGAEESVGSERTRVLGLQDQVVGEIARCDDVPVEIARARSELAGSLLVRDSPRIWEPESPARVSSASGRGLGTALRDSVDLTAQYLGGWATPPRGASMPAVPTMA